MQTKHKRKHSVINS